jgi:hypothetical protein
MLSLAITNQHADSDLFFVLLDIDDLVSIHTTPRGNVVYRSRVRADDRQSVTGRQLPHFFLRSYHGHGTQRTPGIEFMITHKYQSF